MNNNKEKTKDIINKKFIIVQVYTFNIVQTNYI